MPKLHQVTIPHSVFAELQNFLAAPDSPFPPKFRLTLTTLLAAMIGRIRLFQSTEGGFPNVLEWQIDAETRASDFRLEPASLVSNFEPSKYAIEMLSSFQRVSDVDLFVDLSVDPSDRYLSIDLTTEPVLEGQDLATLAAASAPETLPPVEDFHIPLDDIYLTAAATAELLGVNKSTVTRRIEKGELIGFQVFKKALRIPRNQFKNGDVVAGVADVLALFKIDSVDSETLVDHKAAWAFLASTIYPGDAAPRPIDRLRAVSSMSLTLEVVDELALAKQSLDYGDHI